MVVTGVAVVVALIAVIALVIVASKGGGKPSHQLPGVPAVDTVSTESTPTAEATESTPADTSTTATVEASQVEQVLNDYTQDYSNEDLEALKGLFTETLERHDGNKAPEDLDAAIATYEHQFRELQSPSYTLSSEDVEPGSGEASATAHYSISSQNGTVTGSITFHLTEQEEKLLIDKLTIEPSA